MTILEKIKFEEDWLSEVNLTKENIKIAFAGIRSTVLEQQPSDDCISREAVLDILCENKEYYQSESQYDRIEKLPSVQPTRPKGKWIPYYDRWGDVITMVSHFKCSVCGEYDYDKDKFCPNCGAKMEDKE